MKTHTPTPWTIDDPEGDNEFGIFGAGGGDVVAYLCQHSPPFTYHLPNCEADAAFIVRACNSHEALVAALRDLLRDGEHDDDAINAAHAALTFASQSASSKASE